jgi:transcriptional regulator of heat shock response
LKTDVSELKTDVSELKTDVSELKTTVNRIDNNTADIREEMVQNFDYTNKMLDQAFEKISDDMEEKEKVNTIFDFLKKQKNKTKLSSFNRKIKKEKIIA